jgi:protein-S-isoprenylcysteine O-methyltransferase Ste14
VTNDAWDNAGVVAPPPLTYLAPLILGLLLDRKIPASFLPRRMARTLGWRLLGNRVLFWGWFIRTMRRADTPINPREPASRLVIEGPFRHTRNPGYVSFATVYAGLASLANALWAILLLPAALLMIQRGVIEREERYLERRFGEEYLRYKARMRRWI